MLFKTVEIPSFFRLYTKSCGNKIPRLFYCRNFDVVMRRLKLWGGVFLSFSVIISV